MQEGKEIQIELIDKTKTTDKIQEFNRLKKLGRSLIVLFKSDDCDECKLVIPQFLKYRKKCELNNDKLIMIIVDLNTSPELFRENGIQSYPVIKYFDNEGKETKRIDSFIGQMETLLDKITTELIELQVSKLPILNNLIKSNISGLMRFEIFYNKNFNKVVYILGESHDRKVCHYSKKTATDIFFNLLKIGQDINCFFDIFLELGYNPIEKSSNKFKQNKYESAIIDNDTSYLKETEIKLAKSGCLDSYKNENCQLKNTRIHSSDIRETNNEILDYFEKLLTYSEYCLGGIFTNKQCKNIYDNILRYKMKENIKDFKNELKNALKDSKVQKQIENIPSKYKQVKDYVDKIINKIMEEDIPKLIKSQDVIKKIKQLTGNEFVYNKFSSPRIIPDEEENTLELLENLNKLDYKTNFNSKYESYLRSYKGKTNENLIIFMNIMIQQIINSKNENNILEIERTISEIKEFFIYYIKEYREKVDKKVTNKDINNILNGTDLASQIMDLYLVSRVFRSFRNVQGKYSDEPKNIIIYTGDFHSKNYSNMFIDLGFEKIFSSTDRYNCVDMSKLNKLLFIK